MSRFSNRSYLQAVAAQLRPELAFPVDRPETWPSWRSALRGKVAELLGGLPPARGAVAVELLERSEEDGYLRKKLAIVGQRLRDDLSAVDYLCTLDGVDPARIGCVGLSEGGRRTLYLAAMDDRINVRASI